MMCGVFYDKNMTKNDSLSYRYSEQFFFYSLCEYIFDNKKVAYHDVDRWLKNTFRVYNYKNNYLEFILSKFPQPDDGYYILSDFRKRIMEKTKRFIRDFVVISWESKEKILKVLSSFIGQRSFNIASALPWLFAFDKLNNGKPDEFYHSAFFNALYREENNYMKIDKYTSDVDQSFRLLTIDFIFSDKTVVDAFFANGINTIGDMCDLSVDSMATVLSCDIENNLMLLGALDTDMSQFPERIIEIYNRLSEREKEIIAKRHGFGGKEEETLEQIGKDEKLTRERVRQIEAKGINRITSDISKLRNYFACLYYQLLKPGSKYVLMDDARNYFKDELISDFLPLLMSFSDSYIKYDDRLGIIYNEKTCSLAEIKSEIVDAYGIYILKEDYEQLDHFEKKVVTDEYRLVDDMVYLKRGLPNRFLAMDIIDLHFLNGYHISNDDDYAKFKDEYINRYKYWDEMHSPRIITTYLDRENYCLIDRGTYLNRELTHKLPDELLDSILNYLLENQPTVYYKSIYTHFESELNSLGINTYYYLKGVLDERLPAEFNTKRDYIQVGDIKMTAVENITMTMRSFDGKFTLEDLKMKFEGVKEYVFTNILYREVDEGLIWISAKEYIYFDKAEINLATTERLWGFVESLFESLETEVLTSRKIYARLALTNKELLDELKIVRNQFALFSLLKYLYDGDLYFDRPLIAKDRNHIGGNHEVIKEYVSTLDQFNHKTITQYMAKLSLRGLYSYMNLMEEMSENYVQINMDTMVKKDKVGATEEFIKEFKDTFDLIFSSADQLDTRRFNGYAILPHLNYGWNKYLLVGIIRTFFGDDYEIENTDKAYDSTDFIIRRLSWKEQ